ncbi:MAG: hypothetical protein CMP91_07920 [Gammaproteobacteria bacterium]|nr:hypothetical protein [Gammaproteobacteria bacterium]MAY03541.1 hypothetical protein [Gammaproteobacteria bacterium]|tara:strand:- start:337 stop:771 length:435 start_codon:yes stop_codon:yes gene_type:complete
MTSQQIIQSNLRRLERRILPRCELDTQVEVSLESRGEIREYSVKSINISMRAIELSCGDALIQAILAQSTYPHECEVSFSIPGQSKEYNFTTHVVTHRRLSQNEYQLVLRFCEMKKSVQEKLLDGLTTIQVARTGPAKAMSMAS